MSAKDAIIVGGEPRIDFLPPEIKQKKELRRIRRSLGALVVMVIVVCVVAYAGVTTLAIGSQLSLESEQAQTRSLLAEQAKYGEVRTATGQIAAIEDALLVGSSTEVLWLEQLARLTASLPEGATVVELTADVFTPLEAAPAAVIPLEYPRVGTITLKVSAPSLGAIAAWRDSLKELAEVADLWSGPATVDDSGAYIAEIIVNIDSDSFARRYFANTEPGSATEADE